MRSVLERAPERFVLAGYSMGGRIALHIALAAPERIERLVVVSTTPGIQDAKERTARKKIDRRLADEIEQGSIEEFSERWRAQAMFAEDPPEVDRLARAEHARNRPEGLAAALRGVGTGEMRSLWDRLPELEMPVTVLAGRRDRKFVRVSEKMVSQIPEALLQVGGGGHCLLLEQPRSVAAAIAIGEVARGPSVSLRASLLERPHTEPHPFGHRDLTVDRGERIGYPLEHTQRRQAASGDRTARG